MQNAWQTPADVADIHDEAFRACLAGIECASRGVSDSLLVYGAAGSGKTHLLTRVQRHLVQTQEEAPDQVLRCVFVFVRLQTAPQLLWQHVRRRLATDLMRRDQGMSQLQRLIAHQISRRTGLRPVEGSAELIRLIEQDERALSAHLRAWIHVDCDVFADELVPAVDYRVPGGLNPDEMVSLLRAIDPIGVTVTIYNPTLDPERRAARAIVDILARGLRRQAPAVF